MSDLPKYMWTAMGMRLADDPITAFYHQRDVRALLDESRDRKELINWWRERYCGLMYTLTDALDGKITADKLEDLLADRTEYPLANGCKDLLKRLVAVSGKQGHE